MYKVFIPFAITLYCYFRSMECSVIDFYTLKYKANGIQQAAWILATVFSMILTVVFMILFRG
jgi:hypothetical protein